MKKILAMVSLGLTLAFLTGCASSPEYNTEYLLKKREMENQHSEYMARQPFFNGDNAGYFVFGGTVVLLALIICFFVYRAFRVDVTGGKK